MTTNLESLIQQLQQERAQLDHAIDILSSLDRAPDTDTRVRRKRFSAAARRRMSLAQKARWRAKRRAAN